MAGREGDAGRPGEPVEEALRAIRREIEKPADARPGAPAEDAPGPDEDVLVLTDVVRPGPPGGAAGPGPESPPPADGDRGGKAVARRAEAAARAWAEAHLPRMVREAVERELGPRGGGDRT